MKKQIILLFVSILSFSFVSELSAEEKKETKEAKVVTANGEEITTKEEVVTAEEEAKTEEDKVVAEKGEDKKSKKCNSKKCTKGKKLSLKEKLQKANSAMGNVVKVKKKNVNLINTGKTGSGINQVTKKRKSHASYKNNGSH